ncbi:MAG: type I phosphomannose isomerase catalytic subunit, partial [Bacteroidota bacterium]
LNLHGKEILGMKNHQRFGNKFPLLIKFIDAKRDLSVQLHPNDKLARQRHDSFGKTEMWYVMQADEDAKLIVGFNQNMDSKKYLQHLEEKRLVDILNFHSVKAGDTYFIEAGRIHAIGGGVLLAEIQQTSDITYRVYDWDRKDADGNERDLHNDIAIEAFNFDMEDDFKVSYKREENKSNSIVSCPYFITNFIPLNGIVTKNNEIDSFKIYLCVEGEFEISTNNHTEFLSSGETVLLPANISEYTMKSKNAKLLEVFID